MNIPETIESLKTRKEILKNYLQECIRVEDWHGVQDCASDIRDVNAQLQLLKKFLS